MNRDHVNAILTLIGGSNVYVTRADPNATRPYVVIHPDQGLPDQTALANVSDWTFHRFQTTTVADGWESATDQADAVSTALLDQKLTLSTEKTSPIRKDVSLTVAVDDSLPPGVVRFMARDVWTYSSVAT
jgi:hypothetical protein